MEEDRNIPMANPIDRQFINIGMATSGFFIVIGLFFSLIFNSIIFIFIGGGICFLLLAVCWLREYYLRPRSVIITDDGVQLLFRYKKERPVPWNEMAYIYIDLSDPSTAYGRFARGGALGLSKGETIHLTPEIAQKVSVRFRERTGFVLPDYREYCGFDVRNGV